MHGHRTLSSLIVSSSFCLLAAITFSCSDPSSNLEIRTDLEVGHPYRMEIVKAKISIEQEQQATVKTITNATFTLQESGNPSKGTLLYGKTELAGENATEMLGGDWSGLVDVYRDIQLEMDIPEKGTPTLTNFEAVKAKVIERLMEFYTRDGQTMGEEQLAALEVQMNSTYDTPQKLMESYFPGAMLYLSPPVRELSIDQVATTEALAPNPFGGNPFPMKGAFQYTFTDSMALVEGKETISPEKATHILRTTYAELAAKSGSNLDTNNIPAYSISNNYVMHYDYNAGHMVMLRQTRNTNSGGMDQANYTEVKLYY